MDAAVVLAALAGMAWALNIVIVRWGVERTGAPALPAAFVGVSVAAAVAAAVALVSGQAAPALGDVWPFALVGAIAPGSSQGLFVAAISSIGPARASILVGTAPMLSVVLAILVLDESWQAAIVAGTLLTIMGGTLISWQPANRLTLIGTVFAVATAATFAVRDVVAREVSTNTELSPWWAGAIVLGAAAAVLGVLSLVSTRRRFVGAVATALPEFVLSGIMIAIALSTLLAALDRGAVGVVAPMSNAFQHVTVVVVGSVIFGSQERTPRVLAALVLVAIGGALVATA